MRALPTSAASIVDTELRSVSATNERSILICNAIVSLGALSLEALLADTMPDAMLEATALGATGVSTEVPPAPFLAMACGSKRIMKMIFKPMYGRIVPYKGIDIWVYAAWTCSEYTAPALKYLSTASINGQDDAGTSPLMIAAKRSGPAVVRSLLNCGAKQHLTDQDGATALLHAVKRGNHEVLSALVNGNAPMHPTYFGGLGGLTLSPLMVAVLKQDGAAVDLLLGVGGSAIDAQDGRTGNTALHFAVELAASGSPWSTALPIIASITAHHADTAARNKSGETPFTLAFTVAPQQRQDAVIGMLLQSLKSYIHRTAIGYTEGHNHVMSLICDADADEENERRGSEFQEEVMVSVDRASTQRCTTLADAVLECMTETQRDVVITSKTTTDYYCTIGLCRRSATARPVKRRKKTTDVLQACPECSNKVGLQWGIATTVNDGAPPKPVQVTRRLTELGEKITYTAH